jgi:hypothetical protein
MNNFPFKYFFYGSEDSLDLDVLIEISKEQMSSTQEERKQYLKQIETEYNFNWNSNLIVIENGYISDTIYPKSWIDSLNNSLFITYKNHLDKQKYELPIKGMVKRSKLLAIYKTVRTILAMLSRSHYRTIVKPILNSCHDFYLKLDALKQIDFASIKEFNQRNMKDVDIWKVLAFYIAQNISLVKYDIEIYEKKTLLENHYQLSYFINRKQLSSTDIYHLNLYLKELIEMIENYGIFESEDNILKCKDEKINMKNETFL